MEHLSKDQLIEYQFQLGSDEQARATADHLESCGDCRKRLEQLKKKFSALDLLREDVHADEQLISRTLVEAKRKPVTRQFHIWRSGWSGAAAAVIIVAGGILLSPLWNKRTEVKDEQLARAPAATKKIGLEYTGVEQDTEMLAVEEKKGNDWVPERPPFAPASNIELVTLPRREDVQITIYNSADLTLVREKRNLTMKRGWNWLQFMWANTLIDPTSLSLEPLEHKDKIDVEQLVFPPRLKELGRWLIKSQVSGQVPFEITYLTSGISWRAFYMGTMAEDEKSMTMQGYVRVTNKSGEEYEDAQTRLIVGQVHILDTIAELAQRQYPYNMPEMKHDISDSKGISLNWKDEKVLLLGDEPVLGAFFKYGYVGLGVKEIKKEGMSEYFLYTIQGRETIRDGWGKRLPSFKVEDIPVKSLYKYDEEQWGGKPIRFVSFANNEKHELGETPLPNGNIKIYLHVNQERNLSYVGESNIKYIPVNEEVELNLGPARQVKVEPKLMEFHTENYTFDNKNNISGWDEVRTWRVEISNTRTLPVEIEITRGFESDYRKLTVTEGEVEYKEHDARHARFTLNVKGRTKRGFTYQVRNKL
jgi:hypothetical protein